MPPTVKQAAFVALLKKELGRWEVHGTDDTAGNFATSQLDVNLEKKIIDTIYSLDFSQATGFRSLLCAVHPPK